MDDNQSKSGTSEQWTRTLSSPGVPETTKQIMEELKVTGLYSSVSVNASGDSYTANIKVTYK